MYTGTLRTKVTQLGTFYTGDFPSDASGKEFICQGRRHKRQEFDPPGSGPSPGVGNGNPLQYSCLENPTDRGTWWARVHGVTESQTRLSTHMHTHTTYKNYVITILRKNILIRPLGLSLGSCLRPKRKGVTNNHQTFLQDSSQIYRQ